MGMRRRFVTLALLLAATGPSPRSRGPRSSSQATCGSTSAPTSRRTALPRERPAPITVEVGGKISTTDGSQPPPLQQLRVELNSAGQIESRGLPACAAAVLQSTSSEAALERCRPALVGTGTFEAQLQFSGAPILVDGRALVFNGVVHGRPGMLIHIYIAAPVRVTLVIPLAISPGPAGSGRC